MNSFGLSIAQLINSSAREDDFKSLITIELNRMQCDNYFLNTLFGGRKVLFLDHSIKSVELNETKNLYFQNDLIASFDYKNNDSCTKIPDEFFYWLNTIFVFLYLNHTMRSDQELLLTKDIEIAAKMQGLLIPQDLYSSSQFHAVGYYRPFFELGGDYYDVIPINDQKVAFCIADISGKGINAAIIMANFQAILRSLLLREFPIEQLVDLLNFKINEITKGEKYITLFLGIYNYEDQRLIYVNCGHNPPIMLSDHKSFRLEEGTTILGAFDQLPFCQIGKHYIYEPVKILLYTDGIMDMSLDSRQSLSLDTLESLCVSSFKNQSLHELVDSLKHQIESQKNNSLVKDDISLLAIELR
jgi:sigma-B regulation protein RsbU (phosphoserine phosphatase)